MCIYIIFQQHHIIVMYCIKANLDSAVQNKYLHDKFQMKAIVYLNLKNQLVQVKMFQI